MNRNTGEIYPIEHLPSLDEVENKDIVPVRRDLTKIEKRDRQIRL